MTNISRYQCAVASQWSTSADNNLWWWSRNGTCSNLSLPRCAGEWCSWSASSHPTYPQRWAWRGQVCWHPAGWSARRGSAPGRRLQVVTSLPRWKWRTTCRCSGTQHQIGAVRRRRRKKVSKNSEWAICSLYLHPVPMHKAMKMFSGN